ncbi:carbohydrate kinase [Arthrobacter sp. EH-1B-1]|uniref:Carbohydrate kinase n=1 Tax=Arthrobacter vasquezii TaxID=2977629 RepID=A0ABT6CS43_9MICC|nr:carbohydrate kinase [Arthrobacter vasquezii]MDF9276889.1 carbohydrate kinase [Arthrobacter vasquezii]
MSSVMPQSRILVVGEALMDIVSREEGLDRHPGGSPANVAVGLARLGSDVSLLTGLAEDAMGLTIWRYLESQGVKLLPSSLHAARTSSATAVLQNDRAAKYHFDVEWTLPARPLDAAFDVIHTGSIAAFLEPGAASVRRIFQQASKDGALLSFDPNIRPQLLPPHPVSVGMFEMMVENVDVVKLSDEDAEWLYPQIAIDGVIEKLLTRGPGLIIITRGAAGANLATKANRCRMPADSVDVVDTIGAGDSYMAAVLNLVATTKRLPRDLAELEALGSLAATAAAITVSRAGAQPPTRQDLYQFAGVSPTVSCPPHHLR